MKVCGCGSVPNCVCMWLSVVCVCVCVTWCRASVHGVPVCYVCPTDAEDASKSPWHRTLQRVHGRGHFKESMAEDTSKSPWQRTLQRVHGRGHFKWPVSPWAHARREGLVGVQVARPQPSRRRLSFCWHSLIAFIETPTKGRGRRSRMTVSPAATPASRPPAHRPARPVMAAACQPPRPDINSLAGAVALAHCGVCTQTSWGGAREDRLGRSSAMECVRIQAGEGRVRAVWAVHRPR